MKIVKEVRKIVEVSTSVAVIPGHITIEDGKQISKPPGIIARTVAISNDGMAYELVGKEGDQIWKKLPPLP